MKELAEDLVFDFSNEELLELIDSIEDTVCQKEFTERLVNILAYKLKTYSP
jgi:hypothetical protein